MKTQTTNDIIYEQGYSDGFDAAIKKIKDKYVVSFNDKSTDERELAKCIAELIYGASFSGTLPEFNSIQTKIKVTINGKKIVKLI
jgi:hypothetical protein